MWRSITRPHGVHMWQSCHYYVVANSASMRRRHSRPKSLSPNFSRRQANRLVLAFSIILLRLACPSVRIGCNICRVSMTRSNLLSTSLWSVIQSTSEWSKGLHSASTPLTIVLSRLNYSLASVEKSRCWSDVTHESLSPAPTSLSTSMLSSFSVSTASANTGLITSHIASKRPRSSRSETTRPRLLMACGRYVTFCRLASLKIICRRSSQQT